MEMQISLKNIPLSSFKLGAVAKYVQGDTAEYALAKLSQMNKKAAGYISKLLRSGVSNVENQHDLGAADVKIKEIFANKATSYKRWRPGGRGTTKPYRKHRSNLFIILTDGE